MNATDETCVYVSGVTATCGQPLESVRNYSKLKRSLRQNKRSTMSISTEQFVDSLSLSGILPPEEVDALRSSLSVQQLTDDGLGIARELVRQKKLTSFQARSLCESRETPLVLGDYVVLDEIGSGGMGQVYKARHRRMDRIVAIKILPEAATRSPDAIRRFRREIRTAARLDHTNVVDAHDAGEDQGLHFLVLEYVDGLDLKSHVLRFGRMDVPLALDCMLQAARGLQHLHEQGVIHRDIKPANLLRDREATVKLLDLGLARLVDDASADLSVQSRLTVAGQMLGTADYVSPEQAEDTHRADFRSDIYSLGATLHFLLTGEPPYTAESITLLLAAHQQQPVPSLLDRRSDVDESLDLVFRKMMAKQPDARYASMTEVVDDLQALCDGQPPAIALASPPTDEPYQRQTAVEIQDIPGSHDKTVASGITAHGVAVDGNAVHSGRSTRHAAASVTAAPGTAIDPDKTINGDNSPTRTGDELDWNPSGIESPGGNSPPAGETRQSGWLKTLGVRLLPGFIAGVVVSLIAAAIAAWLLRG